MPSLTGDKSSTASPMSSLKSGKRQSRRREALFDAFRSLHLHSQHTDGEREATEEAEDTITMLNAAIDVGSHQCDKEARHSRSRSRSFFLGSSQKRQSQARAGEGKERPAASDRIKDFNAPPNVSHQNTLEQVSDLVCLKTDQSALIAMGFDRTEQLWNDRRAEMEQERDQVDYSSLLSQIIIPSSVSSQRLRTNAAAHTREAMEASESLQNTSTCQEVPRPLPPKRSMRKRAQSSVGARGDRRARPGPSSKDDYLDLSNLLVEKHAAISHRGTDSRTTAMHIGGGVDACALPSQCFGIASQSSHTFQSLSTLPARRVELATTTQHRKASVSSSGSSNSLSGSPDSFASANSHWAASCYSSTTTVNGESHSRRDSLVGGKISPHQLCHSNNNKVEEEDESRPPLPPIPARFIPKEDALKTPTFGHSHTSPPAEPVRVPCIQCDSAHVAGSRGTLLTCEAAAEVAGDEASAERPRAEASEPLSPPRYVSPSARTSSLSPKFGYGLGLSHVKLALASDIRPLRGET